jgi:DNA N-6-adenine-methyltransferase Dam
MPQPRKYRNNAAKQKAYRKRKHAKTREKFWLTPRSIYRALHREFRFDFDPAPFPKPAEFDGTLVEWGTSNFVNPPFRAADAFSRKGPTAFVRKAIAEHKKGKTVVLLLPVLGLLNMLFEAKAEIRSLGRVKWIEASTGKPWESASNVAVFILRGNRLPVPRGND